MKRECCIVTAPHNSSNNGRVLSVGEKRVLRCNLHQTAATICTTQHHTAAATMEEYCQQAKGECWGATCTTQQQHQRKSSVSGSTESAGVQLAPNSSNHLLRHHLHQTVAATTEHYSQRVKRECWGATAPDSINNGRVIMSAGEKRVLGYTCTRQQQQQWKSTVSR